MNLLELMNVAEFYEHVLSGIVKEEILPLVIVLSSKMQLHNTVLRSRHASFQVEFMRLHLKLVKIQHLHLLIFLLDFETPEHEVQLELGEVHGRPLSQQTVNDRDETLQGPVDVFQRQLTFCCYLDESLLYQLVQLVIVDLFVELYGIFSLLWLVTGLRQIKEVF